MVRVEGSRFHRHRHLRSDDSESISRGRGIPASALLREDSRDLPRSLDIPNFSEVRNFLLRGGQPTEAGWKWLLEQGVTAVVNFREEEPVERDLPPWAKVRYYSIPVEDWHAPTQQQLDRFIRVMEEEKMKLRRKVFVHCKGGLGRTGTFVAAWRIVSGWDVEKALAEANAFFPPGHRLTKEQEKTVREFAGRRQNLSLTSNPAYSFAGKKLVATASV